MDIYSRCAQEAECQFHPSTVRARCLLWILNQVLDLEGSILLKCSQALSPFSATERRTSTSNTLTNICTFGWVVHVAIIRVAFEPTLDVVSLFKAKTPPPNSLAAIFQILNDSKSLALKFSLEGNLEKCSLDLEPSDHFNEKAFTSLNAMEHWKTAYRSYLESVMKTEGEMLTTETIRGPLEEFWKSLG